MAIQKYSRKLSKFHSEKLLTSSPEFFSGFPSRNSSRKFSQHSYRNSSSRFLGNPSKESSNSSFTHFLNYILGFIGVWTTTIILFLFLFTFTILSRNQKFSKEYLWKIFQEILQYFFSGNLSLRNLLEKSHRNFCKKSSKSFSRASAVMSALLFHDFFLYQQNFLWGFF